MSTLRHYLRLHQGGGAVLTLAKACELLPISDHVARADLLEAGLVRRYCGRQVVVWEDVLNHVRGDALPTDTEQAAPRPSAPLPKRYSV